MLGCLVVGEGVVAGLFGFGDSGAVVGLAVV